MNCPVCEKEVARFVRTETMDVVTAKNGKPAFMLALVSKTGRCYCTNCGHVYFRDGE